MSRLIDADKFLEALIHDYYDYDNHCDAIRISDVENEIKNQPTVIDTEKVIKELEDVFELIDDGYYAYEDQRRILSKVIDELHSCADDIVKAIFLF